MNHLETIVCQTENGKEARLERMIKSRIELSKRQSGCVAAWYGISNTDHLFIIQIVYRSLDDFHAVKKVVEGTLDAKDGGLEACSVGPPILGLLDIADEALNSAE